MYRRTWRRICRAEAGSDRTRAASASDPPGYRAGPDPRGHCSGPWLFSCCPSEPPEPPALRACCHQLDEARVYLLRRGFFLPRSPVTNARRRFWTGRLRAPTAICGRRRDKSFIPPPLSDPTNEQAAEAPSIHGPVLARPVRDSCQERIPSSRWVALV